MIRTKPDAFWLSDYPDSNIDFMPIVKEYKLATGSKKASVHILPVLRSVICCGLSSYRGGRVVLYNRSKQAGRGDPRPVITAVAWMIGKGMAEGVKGFWSQDDPTLNRVSSYRGTSALAAMFKGAKTGARYYEAPEYLTELRNAAGQVIKGFKTALDPRSKSVASINRMMAKSLIEIDGQTVRGVAYHRVFNRDWNLGGRFYNQIQTSKKGERALITINGEPTEEKDFRALHIALAYALVGVDLPDGDPYDLPGFSRTAVKLCALVTLNGGTVAGIRKKLLDDDMPQWAKRAGELLDAFTLKHEAISDLMGQDNIGLRLQNLDSDIAERVFLEMAAKDVCTLGWHDSFVVQKSRASELVNVMENAYRDIVRSEPPLIR